MTLEMILGAIAVSLLIGGCALATVGLIGLIFKPDLFEQLHAAGLVTGPGVVLILLASIGTGRTEIITSAILVAGFVLVTGSISTHVIANAGARRYAPVPADGAAAVADGSERSDATGMRVVIAYDGSPAARVATDLASAMDWPADTVIRLLWATDDEAPAYPADAWANPEKDLEEVAAGLRRPDVAVDAQLVHGESVEAIVDATVAFGADLLMVGSRRRGVVQSVLGMSAAGDLVDRAPCPVLVARSTTLRSVLLTTDGSGQSDAAAELVARWPIFDLPRVHVVNVVAAPAPTGRGRVVDATAARLMDAGRDVVTAVFQGHPATRIVEAAHARNIDLVVIGSRGRTGLSRTLLGSVAGEVLASANCSVLIARPPARRPTS
jgi:multicomponent Na+:H+ antiporter subunit G